MAPELLAGQPASISSDIYSLGVVLYQVMVRDLARPVTGDWPKEIQDPLLRDDLRHCLARKPEDRFAGAAQLGRSLRAFPERRAELARREAEELERGRLRRREEKWHRQLQAAVAVAVILVGLAVALGYGLRRAERPGERRRAKPTIRASVWRTPGLSRGRSTSPWTRC